MEVSGRLQAGRFIPGERAPGTRWIGGWMDSRAGLDGVTPLPGIEPRSSSP